MKIENMSAIKLVLDQIILIPGSCLTIGPLLYRKSTQSGEASTEFCETMKIISLLSIYLVNDLSLLQ